MIIKNNTNEVKSWAGIDINPNEYFLVPSHLRSEWANNNALLVAIANGEAIVCKEANQSGEITNISEAIDFLKGLGPRQVELLEAKDSEGRLITSFTPFSNPSGFRFRGASFKDSVPANSTKDIDYKIIQERWINGGILIVDNVGPNDTITFQVVDKDNILGYGFNIVLDEFIKDFYIPQDQKLEIELSYPAKIIPGLYLRLKYTSTHNDGCTVKCNLYLHWKAQ